MTEHSLKIKSLNILIGVTGSVAAIKLEEIINKVSERFESFSSIIDFNLNICIIPTNNAKKFIENFDLKFNNQLKPLSDRLAFLKDTEIIQSETRKIIIFSFCDDDEWSSWSKRDDPVLHIELRKWADLMLISPLDANTLAKLSNGLCDNLLTCIVRAWDLDNINSKPIMIAPAMNTAMFRHPLTKIQLDILVKNFGFTLIDPIEKKLMCGDIGLGAMASVDTLVNVLFNFINSRLFQ